MRRAHVAGSPTGTSRPSSPVGFTIPDCLVVVAIIAVLVALLVPAVSKMRRAVEADGVQGDAGARTRDGDVSWREPRQVSACLDAPLDLDCSTAVAARQAFVSVLLGPYVANAAGAFHCAADDFETSKNACFKRDGLSYVYDERSRVTCRSSRRLRTGGPSRPASKG